MSTPVQATAKPKKSFLEWCKSMRGQQIICTVVFLVLPLLLLFMFTYLPFFKFYLQVLLHPRLCAGHTALLGGLQP